MLRVPMLVIAAGLAAAATGCAVPQPRGDGQYHYVEEPTTKARYHLYLPVDYVKNNGRHPVDPSRKWPLVMTFHGMKPYDNALPQEREWEKEADTYGYIVCAPELETSDSFMEYPLTKEHAYVLKDKRNVVAVMDHVFATTRADPKAVLSTSWSCGGYLAHYFVNRFPDRFTCLAPRLSNFSAELLTDSTVPLYRQLPVAVYIGDGDFAACKTESEKAVAWYVARGFRLIRGKMIDNMGHQRIPQTAAAFFAEQLGIQPLRPFDAAVSLARVQMTDYHPPADMLAGASPPATFARGPTPTVDVSRAPTRERAAPASSVPLPPRSVDYVVMNAGRDYPFGSSVRFDPDLKLTPPPREDASPASGAGATRVAGAPPRASWLDPTMKPAATVPSPDRWPADVTGVRATEIGGPAARSPARRDASTGASDSREPAVGSPGEVPRDRVADARSSGARRSTRVPSRFTPQDAGPRDYAAAELARPREKPTSSAGDAAQPNPPARTDAAPPAYGPSSVAAAPAPRRVNIRLGSSAVGTSPHYLPFSVDLPDSVIAGADFLWLDNNAWMGDEPRGVKILESPGKHQIAVLIITRDNQEYRGTATVHVLERPGTASARAGGG